MTGRGVPPASVTFGADGALLRPGDVPDSLAPPLTMRLEPDGNLLLAFTDPPYELFGQFLRYDCRDVRVLEVEGLPLARAALAGKSDEYGTNNFHVDFKPFGVVLTGQYDDNEPTVELTAEQFTAATEFYVAAVHRLQRDRQS